MVIVRPNLFPILSTLFFGMRGESPGVAEVRAGSLQMAKKLRRPGRMPGGSGSAKFARGFQDEPGPCRV